MRSAAALPGDEVDETTKAALAATPPEELMPLSFEGVVAHAVGGGQAALRPSVLTYIDQHTKATWR